MKILNRLRHFWRNSKCIGMYTAGIMFVDAIIAAIKGDIGTILLAVIAAMWCLVWHYERTIRNLRRTHDVDRHKFSKDLHENYELGCKYGYKKAKKDTINKACKWLDDHFDDEMYNKSFVEWLPMFRQALENE